MGLFSFFHFPSWSKNAGMKPVVPYSPYNFYSHSYNPFSLYKQPRISLSSNWDKLVSTNGSLNNSQSLGWSNSKSNRNAFSLGNSFSNRNAFSENFSGLLPRNQFETSQAYSSALSQAISGVINPNIVANWKKALEPTLKKEVGGLLNSLAQKGILNSSVTSNALSSIGTNIEDLILQHAIDYPVKLTGLLGSLLRVSSGLSKDIARSKSLSFSKDIANSMSNSYRNTFSNGRSFSYNPLPAISFLSRLMGI